MLKKRSPHSHKGENGRVLVVGGSVDYVGAPAFVGLSALATLRSGADLVDVASPEKVAWAVNCVAPDIITIKLKGNSITTKHLPKLLELSERADVVVIGNGMDLSAMTKSVVNAFLKKVKVPVIIDATALRVVNIRNCNNCIFLPHGGELKDLLKNSNLTLSNVQRHLGSNVLVVKGYPKSLILSKNKRAINTSGNAGMTHGGCGDVLAGIIAGLVAQDVGMFDSARLGCLVNGKAADLLLKKFGYGFIASDLVGVIPFVLRKFWK